jgi:hypothetical protein
MSNMARAFQVLYRMHRVTLDGLKRAVADNVITAEEYQSITGQQYLSA